MKRKTHPSPRPGALAATMAFLQDPDRPQVLELRHKPGCATERGEPCDCCATLEQPRHKEVTP
jgi:hypothetical protein